MKFFKKGDRVLIKHCVIRRYIDLTGTVVYHKKDRICITLDNPWNVDSVFTNDFVEVVSIQARTLKNE